jgi:hypothetical protein
MNYYTVMADYNEWMNQKLYTCVRIYLTTHFKSYPDRRPDLVGSIYAATFYWQDWQ